MGSKLCGCLNNDNPIARKYIETDLVSVYIICDDVYSRKLIIFTSKQNTHN